MSGIGHWISSWANAPDKSRKKVRLLSFLLFLNELSYGSPQPRERVDDAMERFVELVRCVRHWRSDSALVTDVRREHLELGSLLGLEMASNIPGTAKRPRPWGPLTCWVGCW